MRPMPALSPRRILAAAALLAGLAVSAARASPTNPYFGLFVASRNGDGFMLVAGSDDREMSHPRISPDRQRVVYTRYTTPGPDGKAREEWGYEGTEIVMVNLDGTGERVLVPAKPGVVTANASWSPDSRSVYYLSTDNPQGIPEFHVYDLRVRTVDRMPTPWGLPVSDPHRMGNRLVFSEKRVDGTADPLWTMNMDGSGAYQLTAPLRLDPSGAAGDYDPRLSPDGSTVAFMRVNGGSAWRLMTLDLATMRETPLTPPGVVQELPAWSSDGARLVYTNLDVLRPWRIGLYTARPDGSDAARIPLPRGRLYSHASWFPLEGSSAEARLTFTGTLNPGL